MPMKLTPEGLAGAVRAKRALLKKTQAQIAAIAGVSVETVRNLERRFACNIESACKILDALNIGIEFK